jgi:ribosomal protein S12 methylthiotransferase accessory factor
MKLKEILNKMYSLVGKENIISGIKKSFQFTDEPKFFQYTAFINDLSSVSDSPKDNDSHGSALDLNKDLAQIKALGEALERYCLAKFRKNNFLKSNFESIKERAVSPIDFINYIKINKELIDKNKTLQKEVLLWTKCEDVFNNRKIMVPSQIIYVPYKEQEIILRAPISSGSACATSKEEAMYKGICELIERDAFMIYYLNKIPPEKIDLSTIKKEGLKKLVLLFQRYFLEVNLFNISTDLKIPTILCVLIDKIGVGPAVSIGTKTDWDIDEAIKGAIFEAQHTRIWIRDALIKGKRVTDKSQIKTIQDRGVYWARKSQIKKLNFILNSKKRVSYDDLKSGVSRNKRLKKLLEILKNKNYSLYIKDLTDKKIRKKGFFVFKSIIPELHPLFLFENTKFLFSDRMTSVPSRLGCKSNKLNLEPHPLV